jgi:hypothetical protein
MLYLFVCQSSTETNKALYLASASWREIQTGIRSEKKKGKEHNHARSPDLLKMVDEDGLRVARFRFREYFFTLFLAYHCDTPFSATMTFSHPNLVC